MLNNILNCLATRKCADVELKTGEKFAAYEEQLRYGSLSTF